MTMVQRLQLSILLVVLTVVALSACNTSTVPGECIDALRDNNVPEDVIELVKNKAGGDLNIVQRTAVRLAFEKAGLDDLCGAFAE